MSVTLHIDQQTCQAAAGASIFDCAETLGVRIPTSCRKQGRCKECLVEVTAGMEHLSPRGEPEKHLQGTYRLSCCARIEPSASGEVRNRANTSW